MDWKTFISSIIDSVAWPIFLVIFIVIFQSPIKALFKRLATLNVKGVSMNFSKELTELDKLTSGKELSEIKESSKVKQDIPITKIAIESPQTAILMGWQLLEGLIFDKVKNLMIQIPNTYNHSAEMQMNYLIRETTLDKTTQKLFNKLVSLRNEITHNQRISVSENDALEFLDYVNLLASRISSATLKIKEFF